MKHCLKAFCALMGLAVIAPAMADTATFSVTAEIQEACLISAEDLDFGEYVPNTGDVAASSTLEVRCTTGTDYAVELDGGSNGTIADRAMLGGSTGTDTLEYNLFTDAAASELWGDGDVGETPTGTGTGLADTQVAQFDVNGLLFDNENNQNASAGNYSDTVTATVTF